MIRAIRQLANRVAMLERAVRSLPITPDQRRKYPVGGSGTGDPTILAWVTEWAVLAENGGVAYRWKYRLARVVIDATDEAIAAVGDETFAGWPDVYAINELELQNQAQHIGYQGTGINQADPYPDGFFLEPIGGGTGGVPALQVIVRAREATRDDGTRVWLIHEVNADNGVCDA